MSDSATQEREANRYPQILRAVRETPWAILPGTLVAIRDAIAIRASGERLSDEEIQAKIGTGPSRQDVYMAGSTAVIPVYGVIVPRADLFTEMSGGSPVQRLSAALDDALGDDGAESILLDIDSPGGSVDLVPEFAAQIRGARGAGKPIVAVANTLAASAAYWLGSQADEFIASPSAQVGSVGVFAAHEDVSKMMEALGVDTTLISAGPFKTEGNPFEPLSDEAKATIQGRVDEAYDMFTADVAAGRRVSVETVRSGYGQGRVLSARQALAEGMADRIGTFDDTLRRLQHPSGRARVVRTGSAQAETEQISDEAAVGGRSFADEADDLLVRAEALVDRTTSLAEVERGHLTVSKRERLTACTEALRGLTTELTALLKATDPAKRNAADGLDLEHAWQLASRF